jgi:hypothetical protein
MKDLHDNIQLFLNKYSIDLGNKHLSFAFRSNPDIYEIETQLPDLWIKTRKQFDKNECYVFEKDKEVKLNNLYPK